MFCFALGRASDFSPGEMDRGESDLAAASMISLPRQPGLGLDIWEQKLTNKYLTRKLVK
jgi:hypothetical protein